MRLRYLLFFLLFISTLFLANAEEVAVILKVKETALLKRDKEIFLLKKDDRIQTGDKIIVEDKGMVIMKFLDEKSIVSIKENTIMEVKQGGNEKKVSLLFGEILPLIKGDIFSVETPNSVAAVKGTDFSVSFFFDTTKVAVNEGIVELSNDKGSISLKKDEIGISVAGSIPEKLLREMTIDIEIKTK